MFLDVGTHCACGTGNGSNRGGRRHSRWMPALSLADLRADRAGAIGTRNRLYSSIRPGTADTAQTRTGSLFKTDPKGESKPESKLSHD